MATRGIDISDYQGNIDLEALKNEIDFVIIRVGYGTKGKIDSKFKRNADLCEELGIPYGFYWYSYALDLDGAEKEADAFISAIEPYNPTMGCWFDMEDADGYKKKNGMPSNQELQDICYRFCEKVEDAGYYTGIYASYSWLKNQLAGDTLDRFDKWVAYWPTKGGKQKGLSVNPDDETDWSMWQFTSDGYFEGYDGRLDTNYAYHDFPNPKDGEPTPEPEPVPEPEPSPEPEPIQKFAIGEQVKINGDLYKSSTAVKPAGKVSDKITNITRYAEGTPHPYNTTGDLGWMNEEDIMAYEEEIVLKPIVKGCRIRFTGTHSYSGLKLADWVHNDIFNVIEVSGDRIVIGKGTVVTAAVNIKDCQRI